MNEFIGQRIVRSKRERRQFKHIQGMEQVEFKEEEMKQMQEKQEKKMEEEILMEPIGEEKGDEKEEEKKAEKKVEDFAKWKYSNFKFPSPLPDDHNNFMNFRINKRNNEEEKEITRDDIFEIFGIERKDSTISIISNLKKTSNTLFNDSDVLNK